MDLRHQYLPFPVLHCERQSMSALQRYVTPHHSFYTSGFFTILCWRPIFRLGILTANLVRNHFHSPSTAQKRYELIEYNRLRI